MDLFELAAILFVCGTVTALSFDHFGAEHRTDSIRWSVLRERYYLAQSFYALTTILAFLFFAQLTLALFGASVLLLHKGIPDHAVTSLIIVAAAGGLFLLSISPRMPVLKRIVSTVRKAMYNVARYPDSVDTVAALIGRAEFVPAETSKNELEAELDCFGVSRSLIKAVLGRDGQDLATPAGRILQEVCSLHMSFAEAQHKGQFRRFFIAKRDQFVSIERDYRHMLRRCARALLLVEDLNLTGQAQSDFELDISSFISEECQPLRLKYQRLLAEIAVSSLAGPASRVRTIKEFGYDIYLPDSIPLMPVVMIFILDLIVFMIPSILVAFSGSPILSAYQTIALGLTHAVSLAAAILLAIAPKKITTFARPSLYHLPWRSYVLFGFLSWAIGSVLTAAGLLLVKMPEGLVSHQHPVLVSMIFSTVFLLVTLLISIRLDVRLKGRLDEYRRGKVRDGLITGLAISALIIVLLISLIALAEYFEIRRLSFPAYLYAVSVVSFGVLGFAIGYLVPSTAEAHLDANRIILSSVEKQGKLTAIAKEDISREQVWSSVFRHDQEMVIRVIGQSQSDQEALSFRENS